MKIAASGVNFIDTYHRSGLYKLPLPAVLGGEGAGTVVSVGDGVTTLKVEKRGGKWVVTAAKNTNSTTTATDLAEPQPPSQPTP